jgi:hypothetical protein
MMGQTFHRANLSVASMILSPPGGLEDAVAAATINPAFGLAVARLTRPAHSGECPGPKCLRHAGQEEWPAVTNQRPNGGH